MNSCNQFNFMLNVPLLYHTEQYGMLKKREADRMLLKNQIKK